MLTSQLFVNVASLCTSLFVLRMLIQDETFTVVCIASDGYEVNTH